MITKLSTKIVHMLCKASIIEEEGREIYIYGFFILLSYLFCLLITALFGYFFGILWESLLFYLFFLFIRRYAGGVHAKKESTCTVMTILAMFLSVLVLNILIMLSNLSVSVILLVTGILSIFSLSPLESNEKPLSMEEYQHYKHISRYISAAVTIIAICGWAIGWHNILHVVAVCMSLEGMLLLFGKAKLLSKPAMSKTKKPDIV